MKENLDLKKDNLELKNLSVKAYSEIEGIKKNFFNSNENNDIKNNLDEQQIKELNQENIIDPDIIEVDVVKPDLINKLEEDKPPIEIITIPDQRSEFIFMSETIPDVNSELVNNLIDNNLVHLPFNNSNIEVLDDNEPIVNEIENNEKELKNNYEENENNEKELENNYEENKNNEKELKNNDEEIENIVINHGILKEEIIINESNEVISSSDNEDLKENVKVLKFNNLEKPKEETKLNIKFQPKEQKNQSDSESEKSLDYTNNDYLEINNNILKKPEKIIKSEPNKFEFISENYNINHINLSNLEKLNIRDIQNISKRYKLDIKKFNSKGDKKINKTKKELCTEIISYLNI